MKILDLGCGTAKVPGAIGLDKVRLDGVDVVHDLTQFPYPFEDNSFDVVYLNDVIEHLPDTIGTMEEVYRLCKHRAKVFVRVVNWNSRYAWADPTHVKAFTEMSFDFFGSREGRKYYTEARFTVFHKKYQYSSLAVQFIPPQYRKFASDYLCNVLEGLLFELMVEKNGAPNVDLNVVLPYEYAGGAAEQYHLEE